MVKLLRYGDPVYIFTYYNGDVYFWYNMVNKDHRVKEYTDIEAAAIGGTLTNKWQF